LDCKCIIINTKSTSLLQTGKNSCTYILSAYTDKIETSFQRREKLRYIVTWFTVFYKPCTEILKACEKAIILLLILSSNLS